MKILFVMKHRGNAGSTHAVANYMRVAPRYGHSVCIYGEPIWYVPELKFSMDIRAFDRVVYVYESELYRIKRMHEAVILDKFPRGHRLIVDTDGMYNPLISIDNYDFNHRNELERAEWVDYIEALGDAVVQTTLQRPLNPRASALPFFGYNAALQTDPISTSAKPYDVLHVGHNWWRWRQVATELLPAIDHIRGQIGRIGFIGLWWDTPPSEGAAAGPKQAFQSNPGELRRLRIETPQAVMYHDVIQTMSSARINIFTQRPLLRQLRLLTLKYFEIFCADTIPLLMLDDEHVQAVYGPAGRELVLKGDVAGKILDALHRPKHYTDVVADIRRHLMSHYSYERRMEELLAAVRN